MAEPRKKTAKKTTAKKAAPKRTATRSSTSSTEVPPVSELTGRTINDAADELAHAAHGWKTGPVGRKGNIVDLDKPVEEIPKGPIKGVHPDLVVYDEIPGDTMQATSSREDPALAAYLDEFPQDEADRLEREQVAREFSPLEPKNEHERRVLVETVDRMSTVFGVDAGQTVPGFIDTGVPFYDRMVFIHGIDPTEPWEPSRCAFDDAALGDMIEKHGCGPWSQSWAFIHAQENPGHQTVQSMDEFDRCRTCGARSPMADAMLNVTITGDVSGARAALLDKVQEYGVRKGAPQTEQIKQQPEKKSWWQR